MIPLAHGDLGSADEIIPALFAVLLLIFVLVRAFVDFVKDLVKRNATATSDSDIEAVKLEVETLD